MHGSKTVELSPADYSFNVTLSKYCRVPNNSEMPDNDESDTHGCHFHHYLAMCEPRGGAVLVEGVMLLEFCNLKRV